MTRSYLSTIDAEIIDVHIADPGDTSAVVLGDSYTAGCTWCYLGATHSENAHLASIDAA